jgi:hypothetical protein
VLNIPTEMVHYGMTKTAQLAISRGIAAWAAQGHGKSGAARADAVGRRDRVSRKDRQEARHRFRMLRRLNSRHGSPIQFWGL